MKVSPARRPPAWPFVLAFFLLLGVALTWPLATRFATDLPGGAHKDGLEDAYQNVWNLWWTVEAIGRPTNLWQTDLLFHPDGPNLLFHTLSPINTLMAAPITAVWGPFAGFNAVALASFALGGLGMWLLARPRAGPGPALLAGIIYVASPFHLAALVTDGQLQIFAHHWLPWYLLFLLEALPRPRTPAPPGRTLRAGALAGLVLALVGWTDWYYTLFLIIFTAGAVVWRLVGHSSTAQSAGWPALRQHLAPFVPPLAALAAVFALGAGPLIVPMLLEAARADYISDLPPTDPWRLSADLVAYLVPPRLQAFWGAAPWDWGVGYDVNRRFFLGLCATALALLAVWRRPAARPWGLAALAFLVLSLGPVLRVNGYDTGIPLPYALIGELPIVRLTRQPDRFNVLVTIALGVLVAHGAAALVQLLAATRPARSPRLASSAALALIGAILLLEYWPAPIVTRAPPTPPFLAGLAPGRGALVEYPFNPAVTYRDAERMLFQTVHGRPISGGYHSRAYPQPQLGLPVLRDLAAGSLEGDIASQAGGWAAALQTLGYSHIIGYKQQPLGPISLAPEDEAPFRALVEAGLGVAEPTYEDAWLIAYAVPEAAPAPVLQLRTGWGPLERTAAGRAYRWLPARAELGLIVPAPGAYRLSFGATPAGGPRTLRVEGPAGVQTLALASGPRRYSLLLYLPAGRTILGLSSVEPPTSGQELEGNGDLRPIAVRFDAMALARAGE